MRSAIGVDGTPFSLSRCDQPASRAYLGDQAPPPPCISTERRGTSVGIALLAGAPSLDSNFTLVLSSLFWLCFLRSVRIWKSFCKYLMIANVLQNHWFIPYGCTVPCVTLDSLDKTSGPSAPASSRIYVSAHILTRTNPSHFLQITKIYFKFS